MVLSKCCPLLGPVSTPAEMSPWRTLLEHWAGHIHNQRTQLLSRKSISLLLLGWSMVLQSHLGRNPSQSLWHRSCWRWSVRRSRECWWCTGCWWWWTALLYTEHLAEVQMSRECPTLSQRPPSGHSSGKGWGGIQGWWRGRRWHHERGGWWQSHCR